MGSNPGLCACEVNLKKYLHDCVTRRMCVFRHVHVQVEAISLSLGMVHLFRVALEFRLS